ncbi:FAD-dependent oxidoreductase [Antrihabitans cavernicola]|nr:NAD(P)/FAD-dependent oxidoreductase [Spelaeibacter cavernicola]
MKVIVIGAGIGGLTLAHILRGFGVDVRVYDRDAHVDDTGGYRLHLNSAATDVLRRRLSPEAFRALQASASGPEMFRQFTFLDQGMRPLMRIPRNETDDGMLIGRIPLRKILAFELGEELHFGREYTRFTTEDDATITAHFADDSAENANVLVGADGARSLVAEALADGPTANELHVFGLAGRTPITDRSLLPSALGSGPAFAIGPKGLAVFLSFHDPRTSVVDPTTCSEVPAHREEPYLLWGAVLDEKLSSTGDLHSHAIDRFAGWSPQLRRLIDDADPESITSFPYLASDPDNLLPWRPGPVTALGDAVHAMPPTGGRGAATAILDAEHLGVQLAIAAKGTTTLDAALREYHRIVVPYAADAIRDSLQPLKWRSRLDNPVSYQVVRRLLPIADRVLRIVD